MGQVLTNNVSLSVGVQSAKDTNPTEWDLLEPNSIGRFGDQVTKVARNPISANRQRRKGSVTDIDCAVEIDADLIGSHLDTFLEGFAFAEFANADLTFRSSNASSSTGFAVAALSATAAGKLQYNATGAMSLVFARGYTNAANNGLHVLAGAATTSDTTLDVASLVTETAPSKSQVEIAGIRADAGDLAVTISSGVATVTSGNNAASDNIDFTSLGLVVGQFIHIGGVSANRLVGAGSASSYGYGRLKTIAAGAITMDKLSSTLIAADGTDDNAGGTVITVDILFGQHVRNVAASASDYLERYFQFEVAFPNLDGGSDSYQYALNCMADVISFSLPLTDKATCSLGFMGTSTSDPTTSRKSGASAALLPSKTASFNTSADIARLRITETDETGLTTDFDNLTITIGNNMSGRRVLGTLGAKYLNPGQLDVDIEAKVMFTDPAVVTAIKANRTVSMDFILKNEDGAMIVDIPSMTLGGGDREFPVNESVLISISAQAFEDATLGTSMGISLFPVAPTA
jgi:hypothetical protein